VEVSWFCGIIEQHGDGTRARANIDNRTGLVSQFWAPTHPKFAHLEASTNNNCAYPLTNQSRNPMSDVFDPTLNSGYYSDSEFSATCGNIRT
jgi:hypothetical protein